MDVIKLSNEELEDLLLDLCGRLELSDNKVELLYQVEAERERRLKEGAYEVSKMG